MVNLLQPENELEPIDSTDDGIIICLKLQHEKKPYSIVVMQIGKLILINIEHKLKASFPIDITDEVIMIFLILFLYLLTSFSIFPIGSEMNNDDIDLI